MAKVGEAAAAVKPQIHLAAQEIDKVREAGDKWLQTLRDNIPRYQFLREQVRTPSRFGNYD